MEVFKLSRLLTWLTCLSLLASLCAGSTVGSLASARSDRSSAQSDDADSITEANYPSLSRYATDLTGLARQGKLDPVNGYDAQIQHTIRVLARSAKNNPVLLSEPGVVRSLVVGGVARKIAGGDVPLSLRDKRVLRLNLDTILAGVQDQDEFKSRLDRVLSEVKSAQGRIILFIDGLDSLIEANESQGASTAAMLEAALARGEMRIIGASTPDYFRLNIARREALRSQLQGIVIDESADSSEEGESIEDAQHTTEAFVGDKISPDLHDLLQNSGSGTARVRVILQGDELKNPELREFLQRNKVRVHGNFNNLDAQAVEVPVQVVEQLANHGQVSYMSLDGEVAALDEGHVEETTGADDVRVITKPQPNGTVNTIKINGAGIGIAILDSGIYAAHKAFLDRSGTKSRVVYSKDFTGENRTDDPYGHGTHVASLAAGNGQIANGAYTGIAPDANIINLRVLNSLGSGKTSDILNALNWILSNRTTYNIRVVNMSLGAVAVNSYKNDPVCRAVRSLANVGIVVLAAAGNEGKDALGRKVYGQIHSPGNEPSAITVGATNTFGTNTRADDTVATYSSSGPTRSYYTDSRGVKRYDNLVKPDIVAPGNKLVGAESLNNTLVRLNPSLDDNVSSSATSDMMTLSGTSMATPVVAGTAALLLQANPSLTPNMIKAMLMVTAQPLRGYNSFEQGAGQLNVAGAMTLAQMMRTDISSSTPLGTPLFTQYPPQGMTVGYTVIAGFGFPWSQGIILNHTYASGYELGLYQKIYAQGVLLGDCELINNGVLIGDFTMLTRGVLLGDSVRTSTGITMSEGTSFLSTGVLIGDGITFGDGVILGDGVLIGDAVMLGDGVMLGDNVSSSSSILFHGDNTSSMPIVTDNGVANFNY